MLSTVTSPPRTQRCDDIPRSSNDDVDWPFWPRALRTVVCWNRSIRGNSPPSNRPFWQAEPKLTAPELQILTGSSDRTIHLYNPLKSSPTVSKSGLIQSYSAHGYEVLDLAVTTDNARFASVGGDKQVFLWDVATARTLKRWSGHFGRVNCVGFGGEGESVVVSGSFDATVRLWDCKSQSTKPIQVLEEAKDSVSSLHVVGHEIVTGSVDGRMRVYDLRMGMASVDVIGRRHSLLRQSLQGNNR